MVCVLHNAELAAVAPSMLCLSVLQSGFAGESPSRGTQPWVSCIFHGQSGLQSGGLCGSICKYMVFQLN